MSSWALGSPLKGHNSVRNWCEPPQLLPRDPRGTSSSSSLPTRPFDTADEPQKWAHPSPTGGGGANRRGMTSQSISLAFLLCFSLHINIPGGGLLSLGKYDNFWDG